MIEVSLSVEEAIAAHARETYPEECCGGLLGRAGEPRRALLARRMKNAATEDRSRRYVIDPLDLLHADDDARSRGLDLIGIYHSHPDHPAEPSEFDRSHASSWYSYLILSIVRGVPEALTAWRYDDSSGRFLPEEIVRTSTPAEQC